MGIKAVKKTRTPYKNTVITACTILAGLLLLCTAFAGYVSPAIFWPIAFTGLFYPVLFLVNIPFLVYWLIKKHGLAVFTSCCLLAGIYNISNYYQLNITDSEDKNSTEQNKLRIMTWNVHYFHSVKNYRKAFYNEMVKIVRDIEPDIICMQEYNTMATNKKKNLNDTIANAMGNSYCYFKPLKHPFTGMAIFSRYPVIKTGYIKISQKSNSNQCIYIDIKKDDKTLRIYNVHLQSAFLPNAQKRSTPTFTGITGNLKKWLIILRRLKRAFVYRSIQVNNLKQHTTNSPYPYIITGDFNDTPASYAYRQLSSGLVNSFNKKGKGFGKTYCGRYPGVQIDYILASPVFRVINYHTVKRRLSDHYPVYSDLEWQ